MEEYEGEEEEDGGEMVASCVCVCGAGGGAAAGTAAGAAEEKIQEEGVYDGIFQQAGKEGQPIGFAPLNSVVNEERGKASRGNEGGEEDEEGISSWGASLRGC